MKQKAKSVNPLQLRKRLGMTQIQFWSPLGVGQSGGSRYEGGRNMPRPVRELLRLVHIEGIDITRAKREDFEVARQLLATKPAVYRRLLEEIRKGKHR